MYSGLPTTTYGSNPMTFANNMGNMGIGALIWVILSFLAAIVGCFLVYFLFVKKDTELKNAKWAWLRSFLRFDKMLIEPILKISYIFTAILTTLLPFVFLAGGFAGFVTCLLTIIFGNLFARLIYEGMLILIMIWKNTTEIKKNTK